MSARGTAVVLAALVACSRAVAGITTQDLNVISAATLANTFLGSGIAISNVTFQGAPRAAGKFTGGAGSIGFDSGIVLGTGGVASVAGPNYNPAVSTDNGEPGSLWLSALAGAPTFDAAILEFDFIPESGIVVFDYVFGSDEYNEFVNSYNDVFAFSLDGVNLALVPGTASPVSVNTVNLTKNPAYFRNNDVQVYGPGKTPLDCEMDGLTVTFTVTATVTPHVTHHIILAIADTSDDGVDSNVFLRASSFSTPAPVVRLAKRAPASAVVGGECTFSLTLSVTGAGTLEGVTVWDTLPAGTSFVSATAGGTLAGSIVTWSLGSIAGDTTCPLSFTVRLGETVGGSILNSASADWGPSATRSTVTSNAVSVSVLRGALAVSLAASPAGPLCAGDSLTWTLGWRNDGAGTLFGVTITDTLPAGTAWNGQVEFWAKPDWLGTQEVSASGWADDLAGPWGTGLPPAGTGSAVLRWVVDRVAPGSSGFVRFAATVGASPPANGLIENVASATRSWDSAVEETETVSTPLGSALRGAAWTGPAVVNVGQTYLLVLTVSNSGCAAVTSAAPGVPVVSGTGVASVDAGPNPAGPVSIPAGGFVVFTWTLEGTLGGDVVSAVTVAAQDSFTGLPVAAGPVGGGTVHLARPAALSSRLSVSPPAACAGEVMTVALTVTNTGETAAIGVSPGPLAVTGPGLVSSGPAPAPPVVIPGGSSAVFQWTVQGSSVGAIDWSATVGGFDARDGGAVVSGPTSASSAVVAPGSLVAALSAPAAASVGQWVTVTLTVTHAGGAAVLIVQPAGLAWPASLGSVVAGPAPGPATLSSGGSRTFTWTFSVSGAGAIGFGSTATGTTCSGPVAAPVAAALLQAVVPARLAVAVAVSASLAVTGEWATVMVTITNTGGDAALNVTPSLSVSGPAVQMGVPSPASVASLAPGASTVFAWTYSASGAGVVTATAGAVAVDALSGRAVAASPAAAAWTVRAPARLVVADVALTPATVAIGGTVTLAVTLRNDGGVSATVAAIQASLSSTSIVGPLSAPAPGLSVVLAPGVSVAFSWTATALRCGAVRGTATATGADIATGRALGPLVAVSPDAVVLGSPSSLTMVASPGTAPAGSKVTLVATLRDECGYPVEGELLAFSTTGNGTSVSAGWASTNSAGEARVTLTLGFEPGLYSAVVALNGPVLSATVWVTGGPTALMLAGPGAALSANAFSPRLGEIVLARLNPVAPGPITVRIYTASGRLVRTLRDTTPLPGGQIAMEWDGLTEDERPVSRGVYIIAINGPGIRERLKVVVR